MADGCTDEAPLTSCPHSHMAYRDSSHRGNGKDGAVTCALITEDELARVRPAAHERARRQSRQLLVERYQLATSAH